jgi:hypothetical protein
VRILRDSATLESTNIKGLFPLGEGAGYSGGIVSSGADGFRLADAWAAWSDAASGGGASFSGISSGAGGSEARS